MLALRSDIPWATTKVAESLRLLLLWFIGREFCHFCVHPLFLMVVHPFMPHTGKPLASYCWQLGPFCMPKDAMYMSKPVYELRRRALLSLPPPWGNIGMVWERQEQENPEAEHLFIKPNRAFRQTQKGLRIRCNSFRVFRNLWFATGRPSRKLWRQPRQRQARGSSAGLAEITETTEMVRTTGVWGANHGSPNNRFRKRDLWFCLYLYLSAFACVCAH